MARKLSAKKFNTYTYRHGPYIVYFDGKCKGINLEIVKTMNEMATKYKKLNVFEIDWNDQISRDRLTPIEYLNKIFIYSKNIRQIEDYSPEKVNEIFNSCILKHNAHVKMCAENIGSRGKRTLQNVRAVSPTTGRIIFSDKDLKQIEYTRKHILRNLINDN